MNNTVYLAWQYVTYHRWKTTLLIIAITLVTFLPAGLNVLVDRSAHQLMARAAATPLLTGARGSPLELTLSSLYFDGGAPALTNYAQIASISDTGLANPIPLYVRFKASGYPIVGTSPDYYDFRELKLASGRPVAMLGEAVIGAKLAQREKLGVGDSVISSPESAFDLAGVYPLKMQIVGVLEPAYTADDLAVFTDIKTTWVIEGFGHGHQDLTKADSSTLLSRDNERIIANASLIQYNEITPENADSFHFHGSTDAYPLSAILIVPNDEKSGVILQGRLQADASSIQVVEPDETIRTLLDTVFTVQQFVIGAVATVGIATVALAILVFLLSLRLRQRERITLFKIGGSRGVIAGVMGAEIISVIIASSVFAMMLTLLISRYGAELIRMVLTS